MPKPVLAAVNGPAAGIGCSLALACDLVVAAESSFFLLAFINVGLVPDGGSTAIVPARIGAARAAEMAMLGERVPAPQALEWGLINRVVPDAELDRRRRAAARPPRRRARPRAYANASGCSIAPSTPTSPASSTPRPRHSASRAGPATSSRACSRSPRSARRASPAPEPAAQTGWQARKMPSGSYSERTERRRSSAAALNIVATSQVCSVNEL